MAYDTVLVPWASEALVLGHVTAEIAGACSTGGDGAGGRGVPVFLSFQWCSWVSCGTDWGRVGPLVLLSLCLFLGLLVLGGQRARGTSAFSSSSGRKMGHWAWERGSVHWGPQLSLPRGPSL